MTTINNTLTTQLEFKVNDQTRHGTYVDKAPYENFNDRSVGGRTTKTVQVKDGRKENNLTLDEAAFELVGCPTGLATEDFYKIQAGDETLKEKYFKEVSDFVKRKIGCDKVVCFQSQVRNEEKSGNILNGQKKVDKYLTGKPHVDSTSIDTEMRALGLLEKENDTTKYQRVLNVNLWRSISKDPIQNHHLAMMDERSAVKPDDYLINDVVFPKPTTGDGYEKGYISTYGLSSRHSEHHKWFYFPSMTKSEGILFKQHDTDFTKIGRTCFHTAVYDPNASSDAPPRESIEVRMMCYWKEAEVDSMPTKENIHFDMLKDPRERWEKQPLESASALTLLLTMMRKNLVLAWLLTNLIVPFASLVSTIVLLLASTRSKEKDEKSNKPYTGNPKDYADQFVEGVEHFDSDPKQIHDYAKNSLKGRGEKEGVSLFTEKIIDDYFDEYGTGSFKQSEKKEITSYLINDKKYMAVAKKHLRKLM